jgi:hypothetical protein
MMFVMLESEGLASAQAAHNLRQREQFREALNEIFAWIETTTRRHEFACADGGMATDIEGKKRAAARYATALAGSQS